MTTPGNQELLEMIQVLEQKVTELQTANEKLKATISTIDFDLDKIHNRTNRMIDNIVFKADWNEGLHVLRRVEALNDVDIWAARSVAQVFDRLGVDYPRTPKSDEPSFTQNWLVNCSNPIAQLVRQAREIINFIQHL